MMALYAGKALGLLGKVPWQVWLVAAVLLTGFLWGNHRYGEGVEDTEAKYAAARAQAVEKARSADAVGVDAAQAGKASVEVGNEAAREAARGSGDPLRDGLEALR